MVALFHSDSFETWRPLLAHPPSSILSFQPSLCYEVLFVFSQFFSSEILNKAFLSTTYGNFLEFKHILIE